MNRRTIRLCYRKIIGAASTGVWERFVFDDSYAEFLLQAQTFNQNKRCTTYAQLLLHAKGADALPFLVSASVTGYLRQLNGIIPDVANALGKTFLPFANYRFEIINSDLKDKSRHQVAVNFYSEPLTWLDTIGTQLLLSRSGNEENGETLTEMVSLQPFVSIYSLTEST